MKKFTRVLLIGSLILTLCSLSFTGCIQKKDVMPSARASMKAFTSAVITGRNKSLVSTIGYSDQKSTKYTDALSTAIADKVQASADAVNGTLTPDQKKTLIAAVTKNLSTIEYSIKEVSKDKNTATYTLQTQYLDYSNLSPVIETKAKEQIASKKITTKQELYDAVVSISLDAIQDIKPTKETKSVNLTLKRKKISVKNQTVYRFVPTNEKEFLDAMKKTLVQY